ncbi:MAG: DUF4097 domain-containing protein [Acidobacteria bacterium]|nr:DUF4097 domain-containing protein [Acidobacteriota bacterium]
MRRHSVIGPMILILIGALFLMRNFIPDFRVFDAIANFWPWLLIGWGVLRVVEVLNWHRNGQLSPRGSGMNGGEWTLVVFIYLIGSEIYSARHNNFFRGERIRIAGWDLVGESFDFAIAGQQASAGKTPRIVIENSRGDVRINGVEAEEIRVAGTKSVRAVTRDDAERDDKSTPFEIVRSGDQILIRTNLDRTGTSRIRANIEISVPKGASIEARGKYGDFDIDNITGAVEVTSENAGVRMNNIGGAVRVDLRRSDVIRVMNAKGAVELKGKGNDIDVENIGGPVTVAGSYAGDIKFRNLEKPLRFEGTNSNIRVEKLEGELEMVLGKLSARRIAGPIQVTAKSKDIELADFSGTVEIELEKGDIDLRPGRVALSKINARTKAGRAELVLPSGAKLELRAETKRGSIDNDYGAPFKAHEDGRASSLSGSTGGGPEVRVEVERGEIRIRKSGVDDAPAAPATPKAPVAPKTPLEITKQ